MKERIDPALGAIDGLDLGGRSAPSVGMPTGTANPERLPVDGPWRVPMVASITDAATRESPPLPRRPGVSRWAPAPRPTFGGYYLFLLLALAAIAGALYAANALGWNVATDPDHVSLRRLLLALFYGGNLLLIPIMFYIVGRARGADELSLSIALFPIGYVYTPLGRAGYLRPVLATQVALGVVLAAAMRWL